MGTGCRCSSTMYTRQLGRGPPMGIGAPHLRDGDADGGLGRAVGVDEPRPGRPGGRQVGRTRLGPSGRQPQPGARPRRQLAEDGGQQQGGRHPLAVQHRRQPLRVVQLLVSRQHQRRPATQGEEDLPDRDVEAQAPELQYPVVAPDAEDPLLCRRQVADPAVGHHDPLGAAGGARGVDGIGRVGGRRRAVRIVVRLAGNLLPVLIEEHDPGLVVGQRVHEAPLRQEHGGPGITEHERQAVRRVDRIQRQVGPSRLQDPQQGHDHPR